MEGQDREKKVEDRQGDETARTSVLPPAAADYTLDLETALGLAGVENPTIALAAEEVRASQATLLQARAILLPDLDAGTSFNLHRGNLESARGVIRDVDRESLYAGAGASAVGAGTAAIPGVRVVAHLADAVFAPPIARQRVIGRSFDAEATRNAVLLDVVTRYFDLAGAEARLRAVRQSQGEVGEVVRLTANFAHAGQGREGDAERARTEALLLQAEEQAAEEGAAVASAALARLLSLDPAVRLHTAPGPVPLVQLVDSDGGLEPLVEVAVRNRPEVGARTADVVLNATRLRQERVRPLLPFLSAGFSAGTFGGSDATEPRFGRFGGRTDFDVLAVWRLDNLGLGNRAVQRRVRAELSEAEAERLRVIDVVRREVAEAYAQSESRRREAEAAARQVRTAEEGYRLDLERSRNLQGRPIEVLNSANLLNAARQDLIRATVGHDQAQFQLFVALGQPPTLAPLGRVCPPPGGEASRGCSPNVLSSVQYHRSPISDSQSVGPGGGNGGTGTTQLDAP
jgi:outer membrane protein TolC